MAENYNNSLPKFSGEEVSITLTEGLVPFVHRAPFGWLIHGCDDSFVVIFSTEQLLRDFMNAESVRSLRVKELKTEGFTIVRIPFRIFLNAARKGGARVMLDPVVVSDQHTRWKEPLSCEGDKVKYLDGTYGVAE